MKHRIEIKELCQSNNISSKEQAELIIKEIKNALELYLEVILSFKGVTSISFEASTIIRNYIYDNKLDECIYIINMTRDVRHRFFWGPDSKKELDEKEMNNTNQKKISKFGKWFLDVMNNQGGAKVLIIFGLSALAFFLGPYFIQTFNLMCSDMNTVSKVVVAFGFLCVAIALFFLVKMLIFISKKTDLFK
jgi:hypothetical protein